MLEFGTTVTDINTGYSGKITARAEYDIGTILYLVENIDTAGNPIEKWIDSKRIEVEI
jgi:hypothetical protein